MDKWLTRFEVKPRKWVYVPSYKSRANGHSIKENLSEKFNLPPFYYHLRSGGHLEATRVHLQNHYFAAVDLKNFFESITPSMITRSLKPVLGYHMARWIALESTVRSESVANRHIPFGFVQSPYIATICLNTSCVGRELTKLARCKGITISVYMDDILLSANKKRALKSAYLSILKAIKNSCFEVSESKQQPPATKATAFHIEFSHNRSKLLPYRHEYFIDKMRQENNKNAIEAILSYITQANNLSTRDPANI